MKYPSPTASRADLTLATDYYPFGSGMPGRSFSEGEYRYGFNGEELDVEGMGGSGSTYDYGFRIYNPQIAKFLSVDPLTKEYLWYSPYHFAGNCSGREKMDKLNEFHKFLAENVM